MRRILLISFYFPPFLVMRAIRASKISKYLEREGWEVYVLSADGLNLEKGLSVEISEDRIKRVPLVEGSKSFPISSQLKKSKILRKLVNYQDRFLKWYFRALREGRKILERENIPLILSFSPPYSSNLLASRLSREFNLPWIAEFGDLWSENYYFKRSFPLFILEKFLEKMVLKRASSIITVSEILSQRLKQIHGKQVFLFHHLFDDEDYRIHAPSSQNFTLTYTGHLYPYQNFKPFLNALRVMKEENLLKKINIRFFSYNYYEIKEWFRDFSNFPLEINPPIPYLESIKAQLSSTALLLFSVKEEGKALENPMKGKIFSYIGSRKPVLIVGEDEAGKFLEKIGIGKICRIEKEIKETIEQWLKEFDERGYLRVGNFFDWKDYSYKNRISELSNFLEKFLER